MAAVASLALAPQAGATQRVKILPGFDGQVNAIAGPDANGVTYVGGAFRSVNAVDTGWGALADNSTGAIDTRFPKVSGGSGWVSKW